MDPKPFSEVIWERGPVKVVRVGNWRRIYDDHQSMWIFDKPIQDVVDRFFAQVDSTERDR